MTAFDALWPTILDVGRHTSTGGYRRYAWTDADLTLREWFSGCATQRGTAPFELVRVALVSLILFLSGCSALLFQTLWLRLSGLAFGNSVWSAALILSSFMAGLALGSGIAARLILRRIRPLRLARRFAD